MISIWRKPNTEESKAFRGGLGGGEEFAPISAFPFLWCVTKRKKEKMRVFQDRKILRGMLLFVVVNIWNCYNMGMKKRINRNFTVSKECVKLYDCIISDLLNFYNHLYLPAIYGIIF